ncbi:MAG TPA: hypothetical protein VKF36_11450 [Syntrophorhabdales bacterium]|nr:hypothetical protein [Syntrophorhabdales bacterium]
MYLSKRGATARILDQARSGLTITTWKVAQDEKVAYEEYRKQCAT